MNPYTSTVRYTELSPISFTDFTPSRATRESSNPVLQEHDPLEGIYATVCNREQRLLSFVSCISTPLKGRYVELEFSTSTDSSNLQSETSTSKTPVFFRPHSLGLDVNPTAFGTSPPLRSRSRKEHNRLAFRIKKQSSSKMDLPTFIVDEAEEAASVAGYDKAGFGVEGSPAHKRVQKARVKKRRFSPPTLPPPPPPAPPHVEQATTCTAPPPVPIPQPEKHIAHETNIVEGINSRSKLGGNLSASDNDIDSDSDTDSYASEATPRDQPTASDAVPVAEVEDSTYPQAVANGDLTASDAAGEDYIIPISRGSIIHDIPSNDHSFAENENITDPTARAFTVTVPSPAPRKKLGSISETSSNPSSPAHSCHSNSTSSQTGSPVHHPVPIPRPRAFSSHNELSQNARPPVPPPRKRSSTTSLDSSSQDLPSSPSAIRPVHTRQASEPELLSDMRGNFHSPSFLDIKAGQDCGQFSAEYMGSKECNSYLNSIESCAKQLLNANTREVKVYVSSEKVRLSPPNAPGVLYKSFAFKDILQVEKSKHKRIIGILTWKPKCLPECHAFRCSEPAIANALYESVWLQTQNLKRIKVNMPRVECESSGNGLPSPKASPKELNSIAPSDLLHKFPVTLIGFTSAGKLQSVSDVIEKTLKDNKPSKAKEISVWISLAQVKLVDSTKNPEVIYATHDTSNIRAIGVSSNDNRFVGYTFKQDGKHLTCCVLWCHSAGLMVSLVSYLCQACQITFHQKGNSFHEDEVDGDNWEGPLPADDHHGSASGLLRHLHKHTSSQETSRSPSPISKPSASGTTPPLSRRVDSTSPSSDVSETDDYSRFSVTYIGSATLDPPFTQQSILDALHLFTVSKSAAVQVAAAGKNTVQMQVSATGINLNDQTHRLFITRNYPRKQVIGHTLHPTDKNCFAFATTRPGLSDLKCHIFRVNKEAMSNKVAEAIRYWLDLSLQ